MEPGERSLVAWFMRRAAIHLTAQHGKGSVHIDDKTRGKLVAF